MKKKSYIIIGIVVIIGFILLNNDNSFDEQARDSFDAIDYDFVNYVPVDEMNKDAIKWIHDTSLDMERNPDTYNEREKLIIDGLSKMMVDVGTMNSIDYRDREIEDEYYNVRNSVKKALNN